MHEAPLVRDTHQVPQDLLGLVGSQQRSGVVGDVLVICHMGDFAASLFDQIPELFEIRGRTAWHRTHV
ncbi:hypothetical protein ACFW3D_20535 [Streptomyces sp. NPDC058864]